MAINAAINVLTVKLYNIIWLLLQCSYFIYLVGGEASGPGQGNFAQ